MGLKVVIHMRAGRALVGIQQKGTDPVVESLGPGATDEDAALAEALAAVPEVLARARERWAANPRNPTYQGPPVPPAAPPTLASASASQPARGETKRRQPQEGQMQRLI